MLSEGVRASAAAPARRLSKAFVVAEIALAFALMTTSAILVVHMRNLGRVSLGFEPDGLVAFELILPRRVDPAASPEARRAEQQRWPSSAAEQARLMEALRQTPGVTGAACVSQVTADSGCGGTRHLLRGPAAGCRGQRSCFTDVTPDFFSTLRMSLRAGRFLNESDQRPRAVGGR